MNQQIRCSNCESQTSGNFCQNCGQATAAKRIDSRYAKAELLQLAGYETGFLYTFKKLLVAPGNTIRAYIEGNRSAVTKPVTFLFVASVLYTLCAHYLGNDARYAEQYRSLFGDSSITAVFIWVQENYGYSNLVMMALIAPCVKLLFLDRAYNIYEILVMLCFATGQAMLLLTLQPIITYFTHNLLLDSFLALLGFFYVGWAIGQFYGGKLLDYFKAFAAYSIGFMIFEVGAVLSAIAYDLCFGNA